MNNNKISLYFHIPFCIKKCNYCAFYSLPCASDALMDEYLDALLRQLSAFDTEREVTSVYFGGGTPTVLGEKRLVRLLNAVMLRDFIAADCETTVEVNPKTVDLCFLTALRKAGANRLSVGVQSLCDSELKTLGRIHTENDALKCIDDAFSAGFDNVSVDMIFGFNGQTEQSALYTLGGLISSGATHIAAYSLQYEKGTPMYMLKYADDALSEQDEDKIYDLICDTAKKHGFGHYEISAFAKGDAYRSRHNLGYWQRREYFGFGAAAHSFYNGKRFSSPADIRHYIKNADGRDVFAPTDHNDSPLLTHQEIFEEKVMLGLRTDEGISVGLIKDKGFAERCVKNNLATVCDDRFVLTEKGYRVSNAIIAKLI